MSKRYKIDKEPIGPGREKVWTVRNRGSNQLVSLEVFFSREDAEAWVDQQGQLDELLS